MNKYGAKRTYSNSIGLWFASRRECYRAEELNLMQKAGEISDLQFQVKFVLFDGAVYGRGDIRRQKITITIDFAYKLRLRSDPLLKKAGGDSGKIILYGSTIYEDTKGVLTRDFRSKLAWLKQLKDIDVILSS